MMETAAAIRFKEIEIKWSEQMMNWKKSICFLASKKYTRKKVCESWRLTEKKRNRTPFSFECAWALHLLVCVGLIYLHMIVAFFLLVFFTVPLVCLFRVLFSVFLISTWFPYDFNLTENFVLNDTFSVGGPLPMLIDAVIVWVCATMKTKFKQKKKTFISLDNSPSWLFGLV